MLPLEDVRVLDFTHVPPGQYCTMILGDMGSQVIRVEQPRRKNDRLGDNKSSLWQDLMADYTNRSFNRNKKSLILNLKDEEARRIVHRLAENVDVVVEGFRPGVADRLGMGYETLNAKNPRIIYCSISGYGQAGPYRDMPGHDLNYVAVAGALSLFGDPPPVIPNLIADYAGAGLHSVIGILIALIAREKTGKGQYIDISYADTVVSLMTQFFSAYLASGDLNPANTREITFSNAGYGVYETRDERYIALGCIEPWSWENLCQALGRTDLIAQYAKWENHASIRRTFAAIFLDKSREEWFTQLRGLNIPVAKVNSIEEVFDDEQIVHRQMLASVEDPQAGIDKHVGIPMKLSDTPGTIRTRAPIPGEHTEEVLLSLGYSREDIRRLSQQGTVSK